MIEHDDVPFELTATPSTSPRFMSGEVLEKAGVGIKGISGAVTVPAADG